LVEKEIKRKVTFFSGSTIKEPYLIIKEGKGGTGEGEPLLLPLLPFSPSIRNLPFSFSFSPFDL
jgi:hypothetical protein